MNFKVIGNGNLMTDAFYTAFLLDNVLINAPSGVLKELKRYEVDFDDINIIIVTHLHGEEYFDLPNIIAHEAKRKREKPLVIIGPKDLKKATIKLMRMAFNKDFLSDLEITFLNAETVQNANLTSEYYFSFINIKHGNLKNCFGLIIKSDRAGVCFSAGANISPGLSYMLKEVKNCVITVGDNDDKDTLTLDDFKDLSEYFPINYFPVGYPDELISKIEGIRNAKIIKDGEQFYI